jgi:hypothetical protein
VCWSYKFEELRRIVKELAKEPRFLGFLVLIRLLWFQEGDLNITLDVPTNLSHGLDPSGPMDISTRRVLTYY